MKITQKSSEKLPKWKGLTININWERETWKTSVLGLFGLFCPLRPAPILMALPPPPDVSQPGSFCLRSVSHQNICKSMCGNWKAHVYNSWSPSTVSHRCHHIMWKQSLMKMNHWIFGLEKSLQYDSWKFFSFLRDVTRTGIESPTAAKMSQPKTITHKVFSIPHYLTTWPATIWLFDYLVTGWRELQSCVRREEGPGRASLIILVTDWPLAPALAHCQTFVHISGEIFCTFLCICAHSFT